MRIDKDYIRNKSGIYIFRCLINNKVYIGQSVSLLRRILKHLNLNGDLIITKALRKHGVENFTVDIIEFVDSDMLDEREKYWITFYNSTDRKNGYNIKSDGKTSKGVKLSEQAKKNIANARKKWVIENPEKVKLAIDKIKNHYNKPENKKIQSERSRKYFKSEEGLEFIERTKRRLRETRGTLMKQCKPVKRLDKITGNILGEYNSVREASRKTGKSVKQISYAMGICSRGLPSTGEWIFI